MSVTGGARKANLLYIERNTTSIGPVTAVLDKTGRNLHPFDLDWNRSQEMPIFEACVLRGQGSGSKKPGHCLESIRSSATFKMRLRKHTRGNC